MLREFPALDRPDVAVACSAYLEARRLKHGSWTAQGMRIALRKFEKLGAAALLAGLERATEGPWQTVWPGDGKPNGNGHAAARHGTDRRYERHVVDPTPRNVEPPKLGELLKAARSGPKP